MSRVFRKGSALFVALLTACGGDDGVSPAPRQAVSRSLVVANDNVSVFLHGLGGTANPPTLSLDDVAPTASTAKYVDSPSIQFSGGNPWAALRTWTAAPSLTAGSLTSLADAHIWVGLKNSDDIGTRFDIRVEAFKNGALVAAGETLCVQGVVRNPAQAKEISVSFPSFSAVPFNGATDVLSLRVLTRIGTTVGGAFCGGHSNAVGLRAYFDAVVRPARFDATFAPFSRIAFTATRDGNEEIYVMNEDGSNQERLTNDPAIDNGPAWSPDRTRIAFTSDRSGNMDVWVMNADGSGLTQLTTNPSRDALPTWSPNGDKIAFETTRDGHLEVYVMNADGSGQQNLTNSPGIDYFPRWSPDGQRVLFASDRGASQDIWVMNADGTSPQQLTTHPAVDYAAAWSPDGLQIAFSSERFGGVEEVMIMDVDGTNQTRLTDSPGEDFWPDFSPDGSLILFSSIRHGAYDLFTMDTTGGALVRITFNAGDDYAADWR